MNTYRDPLKSWNFCWFKTNINDQFVGRIESNRFIGNKLTVTFSEMIKVRKTENETFETDPNDEKIRTGYMLEFSGCKVTSTDFSSLKVESEMGDEITLLSLTADTTWIAALLSSLGKL